MTGHPDLRRPGVAGAVAPPPIQLLDFKPAASDVAAEVASGLARPQKQLPCKLFYDQRGSEIFDAICDSPEYYPTRTELGILRECGQEIGRAIGPQALLVEYGSGSSLKTRLVLDALRDVAGYVPIDISGDYLMHAARSLAASYPRVPVRPVCADYTRPFGLPSFPDRAPGRVVAYFPGSTIGNFELADALAFLRSVRTVCGPGSGLLIGVDLKKDPAVLHAAYNDAAGVTAAFNLNILRHINERTAANFDLDGFWHHAPYVPSAGRMEMHLISRRAQTVELGDGSVVAFAEGESIHTESCHKYTPATFAALAAAAGYRREAAWTDPQGWFGVQYLVSTS